MGTPHLGLGGTLGFSAESTWGTAAARTNWLHAYTLGLGHTVNWRDRDDLGFTGAGSYNRRATPFIADEVAGGTIEVPFAYDDTGLMLLFYGFGAVAEGGGGGPTYTHTFTMQDPASWPVGFSCEQILGNAEVNDAEVFEGCLVDAFRVSIAQGQIARLSCDIIAERGAGAAVAGTPTYSSKGNPVMPYHAGNLSWSSLADKVISLEISHRNNMSRRMLFGSKYTAKPYHSAPSEVTWTVVREFDELTVDAAYLAGTAGDATITFTDSTRSMAWTLQNAQILGRPSKPVTSRGITTQTFTLVGYSDGTDEGHKCVVTNANSVYTTN